MKKFILTMLFTVMTFLTMPSMASETGWVDSGYSAVTASDVKSGEMDFGTIQYVDNDTVTPNCSGCHTTSGISLSMRNNGFSGITFTGYDNYHSGKIVRTNL